jgi:hypothetical protein
MHSSLYSSAAASCFGGVAIRESSRRLPAQSNLFCRQLPCSTQQTHVRDEGDASDKGGEEDAPPHNLVGDGTRELEVLVHVLAHRRPPVDGGVELGLAGVREGQGVGRGVGGSSR